MSKECPECGNTIIGREDKKFCSDACRNSFHNKNNRDSKNLIRNVNNQLRKNYRILTQLNPNGKGKVVKSTLLSKGFDFSLYTSTYTTKAGAIYYFVYDQGYLPIDNDFFALVKKDRK